MLLPRAWHRCTRSGEAGVCYAAFLEKTDFTEDGDAKAGQTLFSALRRAASSCCFNARLMQSSRSSSSKGLTR